MSTGYVIPVDPLELAARFPAAHDPRYDEEDDHLGPDECDVSNEEVEGFLGAGDYESRIAPLLDRIPKREADLIYLYFIQRKRQADIAAIFGVTQAAISYRLDRGIQRIKFLLSIPQVSEEELRTELPAVFPATSPCPRCRPSKTDSPEAKELAAELLKNGGCSVCNDERTILIDVNILVGMWQTTCQSEVAKTLGLTQGRVRHRFFKAVKTLEEAAAEDERYEPYFKIFEAISSKKFNILREVKLPQWADRGGDGCL